MRGKAGPWLLNKFYDIIVTQPAWAALLTDIPSGDNPSSSEIGGASYTRALVTWDHLDNQSAANATPMAWLNLPSATIRSVGLFTTSVGMNLIAWCPLQTPFDVKNGGGFTIAAHDLLIGFK